MENADALDLSKENIQPLKRGRNTIQLGLALQAQTDVQTHHLLQKKQEWFEMQIRTYDGEDPLHVWNDYITWVEQSYPKHGPEGNLSILLQKCFQTFKDEDRYKQDPRFVHMWIKYIEMQSDSRRTDLFRFLLNQGIGTTCAEFYKSWAYEFESVKNFKTADTVYQLGFRNMAQPLDDLQMAYNQFQVAVAQYVLHREEEDQTDDLINQLDQRQPMAALKPVGKKGIAPNVRTGSNIRNTASGLIQASQGNGTATQPGPSTRPGPSSSRSFGVRGNNAGPIPIYHERENNELDQFGNAVEPRSGSVPNPQQLNKENVLKAGPWTGQGTARSKAQSSMSGGTSAYGSTSRPTGFEVHRDEPDAENHSDGRTHGITCLSALKPKKVTEDGYNEALAIFDNPDPNTKAMYRKREVYAGGMEFQTDELRAIAYFRKRQLAMKQNELVLQSQCQFEENRSVNHKNPQATEQEAEQTIQRQVQYNVESNREFNNSKMQENLPENMAEQKQIQQAKPVTGVSEMDFQSIPQPSAEKHSLRYGVAESESANLLDGYKNLQPPNPTCQPVLVTEAVLSRSTSSPHSLLNLDGPQNYKQVRSANQSIYNQSMTVHTKQAMNEVGGLWASPYNNKSSQSYRDETSVCLPAKLPEPSPSHFQICHDERTSPQRVQKFQICQDETNSVPPSNLHLTTANTQLPVQNTQSIAMNDDFGTVHTDPFNYLFKDPPTLTTYENRLAQFHMSQDGDYNHMSQNGQYSQLPVSQKATKFQVFCDDEQTESTSQNDSNKKQLSAATKEKVIAKEKENIHKFPIADLELMEECGVAPVEQVNLQNQHYNCPEEQQPQHQQEQIQQYELGPYHHHQEQHHHLQIQHVHAPLHGSSPQQDVQPLREPIQPDSLSIQSPLQQYQPQHHIQPPHQHLQPLQQQLQSTLVHHDQLQHRYEFEQQPHVSLHQQQPQTHFQALSSEPQLHMKGINDNVYPRRLIYAPILQNALQLSEPMDDDYTVSVPKNTDFTVTSSPTFNILHKNASTPYFSHRLGNAMQEDCNSSLFPMQGLEVQPVKPQVLYNSVAHISKPGNNQLSTIMEGSKEKFHSLLSSGSGSGSNTHPITPSILQKQNLFNLEQSSISGQLQHSYVAPSNPSLIQESYEQSPAAMQQPISDNEVSNHDKSVDQMRNLEQQLRDGDINPFSTKLHEYFLTRIGFPLEQHLGGYTTLQCAVPTKRQNNLVLAGETFNILKVLGEGGFAKVLKASHIQTKREVALKVQKPSCSWEYYICREIQHRLSDQSLAAAFMHAENIYMYNNGSVIVTDLVPHGNLLTLVNKWVAHNKKQLPEACVLFLLDQLLIAIHALHSCQIIHGDLKPDNILVRHITLLGTPCLKLIDFGCSIDMSLMPPGTSFCKVAHAISDISACIEMRTDRPWTYQVDLYGIANTAHCLLYGDYMKVHQDKSSGRWTVLSKLPRYADKELWQRFFDTLLNVESCETLPNLETLRADLKVRLNQHTNTNLLINALSAVL